MSYRSQTEVLRVARALTQIGFGALAPCTLRATAQGLQRTFAIFGEKCRAHSGLSAIVPSFVLPNINITISVHFISLNIQDRTT